MKKIFVTWSIVAAALFLSPAAFAETGTEDVVCVKNPSSTVFVPMQISTSGKKKKFSLKKISKALTKKLCKDTAKEFSTPFLTSAFNCIIPITRTVNTVQGRPVSVTFPASLNNYFPISIGTYHLANAPTHGGVVASLPGNYRISRYTPANGYVGADVFRLRATARLAGLPLPICSVQARAVINVTRATVPPTPTHTPTPTRTPVVTPVPMEDSHRVQEGRGFNFVLRVLNKTSRTRCMVIGDPQHGSLRATSEDGCSVTYTPALSYAGADRLTFTVKEGTIQSSLSAQVKFTVERTDFAGQRESLDHYRNTLTPKEVKHLLRKVAYCGGPELEEFAKTHTLDQTVDVLLNGFGDNRPVEAQAGLIRDAKKTISSISMRIDGVPKRFQTKENIADTIVGFQYQTLHLLRYSTLPLKERMTLWLYNQMPVSLGGTMGAIQFNHMMREYVDGIRSEALGSYQRYLTKQNSFGAMGFFLDNFKNTVRAGNPTKDPLGGQLNVNFGREFLELGSLGKIDPITGQPTYTEEDVKAMAASARGLGTKSRGAIPIEVIDPDTKETILLTYNPVDAVFYPERWSWTPESPASFTMFRGTPHEKTAPFKMDSFTEGGDTITPYILYNHPAAARFVAARLYTSLVNPQPTEKIVAALAQELIANRYELKPTLKKLLSSSMMFHKDAVRSVVASPVQSFMCMLRTFDLPLATNNNDFGLYSSIQNATKLSGQILWQYLSIFGLNEGGKNGAGIIHYGEEFLTAQQVLGRQQGIAGYFNQLNRVMNIQAVGINWLSLLPKNSSGQTIYTPEGVLNAYLEKLDLTIRPEDREKILQYLTTIPSKMEGHTGVATVNWDPSDPNFEALLRIKLSGLLAMLSQLVETNLM